MHGLHGIIVLVNHANEQYSPLPRAIADENGYPHKGSKATWKDKLKKRYTTEPVVLDNIPQGWMPDVIIDAMFLIVSHLETPQQ